MAYSDDEKVFISSGGSGCFGCALPFPLGTILNLLSRESEKRKRYTEGKTRYHKKVIHKKIKVKIRKRGTLLVHSHGHILLVMDRGHHKWSLPGGGVEKGEKSFQTAIREIREELGLRVRKLRWLGHFKGATNLHSIYFSNHAKGKVHLQTRELKKYLWWDMESKIKAYGHVYKALKLAREKKYF